MLYFYFQYFLFFRLSICAYGHKVILTSIFTPENYEISIVNINQNLSLPFSVSKQVICIIKKLLCSENTKFSSHAAFFPTDTTFYYDAFTDSNSNVCKNLFARSVRGDPKKLSGSVSSITEPPSRKITRSATALANAIS